MDRTRQQRRVAAGYAFTAALAVGVGAGTLWFLLPGSGARAGTCANRIPRGRSFTAAWNTTDLFVADVILNRSPGCGYDLSTKRLRGGHSRREWAGGRSPVAPFTTRYPAVPMLRASRDPKTPQAVYILSRRVGGFVVLDANGRPTIPMIVGLAAPDAGRGAYNLLLVVEDGSWRVDEVHRVHIVDRVRPAATG